MRKSICPGVLTHMHQVGGSHQAPNLPPAWPSAGLVSSNSAWTGIVHTKMLMLVQRSWCQRWWWLWSRNRWRNIPPREQRQWSCRKKSTITSWTTTNSLKHHALPGRAESAPRSQVSHWQSWLMKVFHRKRSCSEWIWKITVLNLMIFRIPFSVTSSHLSKRKHWKCFLSSTWHKHLAALYLAIHFFSQEDIVQMLVFWGFEDHPTSSIAAFPQNTDLNKGKMESYQVFTHSCEYLPC